MATNSEGILVLCAHPDDQIIGAGGTLAKYSAEGKRVIIVMFSYGESSHPWLRKSVTRSMRKVEAKRASAIVGAHKDIFMGLHEGKFTEELQKGKVKDRIKQLIAGYHVKRILTHSFDDPHPDHQAVVKFVMDLTKNMDSVEVFSFNIWNPLILRRSRAPKMYVDITHTFSKKIKALRVFKSQKRVVLLMFGGLLFGAMMKGIRNGTRFAEGFVKIK